MQELMNTKEAAVYLGCAPSTLKISRVYGTLLGSTAPPHLKIGRAVRYDMHELDKWINSITVEVDPGARKGYREQGAEVGQEE